MKIPPQPTAIRVQTQLAAPRLIAYVITQLLAFACNAPERAPTLSPPSAPVPVPAPVPSLSPPPASPPVPAPAPVHSLSPPSPVHHHYLIAAIGDSLTDPRSHGGGYLEYLKSRCPGIEIDNFGKGGTMVNQMRRSFDGQVAASGKPYTHLIVFGGVNDLYSDLTALRTPAKIEADLGYMYDWAHAHHAQVVALTVAPWGGFTRYFNASRGETTQELNAWIRAQANTGRVDQVVDANHLLACGDPDRLCDRFFTPFKDGLHFGPEGHEVLGQALFQGAFSDCE